AELELPLQQVTYRGVLEILHGRNPVDWLLLDRFVGCWLFTFLTSQRLRAADCEDAGERGPTEDADLGIGHGVEYPLGESGGRRRSESGSRTSSSSRTARSSRRSGSSGEVPGSFRSALTPVRS